MRITKKIAAVAAAAILSVTILNTPTHANEGKSVNVNGKVLSVTASVQNTPAIPAKELCEALGATYQYDHVKMKASITKGNILISLSLDSAVALINGRSTTMPEPMKIVNKRVTLPMEFIASVLKGVTFADSFRNRWVILQEESSSLYYTVEPGDTLWKLSVTFKTTVADLMAQNQLSDTMLQVGRRLKVASGVTGYVPERYTVFTRSSATLFASKSLNAAAKGYLKAWTEVTVVNQDGMWYEVITPIGTGYLYQTVVHVPQDAVAVTASTWFNRAIAVDTSKDTIIFSDYTVQAGDTLWSIATAKGIPVNDLAAANGISASAWLSIGQTLKIPKKLIHAEAPMLVGYGKLADWYQQGNYIFPINEQAAVIDMETGRSFQIRRTTGANHADVETLTQSDTLILKEIFGGAWSWNRRAAWLETGGNRYAVSFSGMPHAGLDNQPYLANVSGRSDNWGYGPNYDAIKGNGMDGHFDLYFLNSVRHKDNQIDPEHQRTVMKATGLH